MKQDQIWSENKRFDQEKGDMGEREREREILLGFWGLPSVHFEREKWTFSLVSASVLWGSFKQFLTRFAHMFEYVI